MSTYTYTRKELDRIARAEARTVRKETGHPARLRDWRLEVRENGATLLVVVIAAYDGLRARHVAI